MELEIANYKTGISFMRNRVLSSKIEPMCKTIKQKVRFKTSPQQIYEILADSKKHSSLTGKKASISKKIGGKFSALGGDVEGIAVDLLPGKRIVQAWRQKNFPTGIYSMAAFELLPTKSGGTELTLTHRGVPKDLIPQVEKTWRELYWNRMKLKR